MAEITETGTDSAAVSRRSARATRESASDGASGGSDLVLTGISKHYGSFRAVDDLDLTIGQGEFFALLGPSGCGKTTTLRMIAGLEEPSAGTIALGGADITYAKPYRRPVNTVFQNYALFPHLDIFENVAFGLRRRGAANVREQAMEALELVELSHLAKRKPTQLSGGQQQRIALARAIVNRPKVLLLDEPLGALDLKLRRQMQVELKRIQTEVGITFVHVTHDQEEAMTMADRVAVMNGGRIEQLGAPADLYESPVTTFVANFLGQSNLVAGQRESVDGDNIVLNCHGQRVAIPAARTVDGDALLLGVRPEKIHLLPGGSMDQVVDLTTSAPGDNVLIGGVVEDVSYTGVSTQYLVAMPWGQQLTVFVQNMEVGQRFRLGDTVTLSWKPAHSFGLAGDASAGAVVDEDAIPAPTTAGAAGTK